MSSFASLCSILIHRMDGEALIGIEAALSFAGNLSRRSDADSVLVFGSHFRPHVVNLGKQAPEKFQELVR